MQNLSDDELDNVFKKAAEDLKPSFNPAHWEELDGKLDNPLPPRPDNKKWIASIIIIIVLTGGIGVYLSSTGADHTTLTKENRTNVTTTNTLAGANESGRSSTEDIAREETSPDVVLPLNNAPASVHQANSRIEHTVTSLEQNNNESKLMEGVSSKNEFIKSNYKAKEKNPANHTNTIKNNKSIAELTTQNTVSRNIKNTMSNKNLPENVTINENGMTIGIDVNDSDEKNRYVTKQTDESVGLANEDFENSNENQEALQEQSIEGNGQVNTTEVQAAASGFQNDSLQEQSAQKEVGAFAKKIENADNEEVIPNRIPKLSVKLALSPDFSAVKYSGYSKPGTNYGLLIEYRILPGLTVNTGAIWSRKVYTASDIEYDGYRIDEADGDCRILDIPINLNYHFKSSSSLSLFVGIGTSSYLMNREEYMFTTKGAYGNSYSYKREFKGKNNEMFSVLNLSVGIQKTFMSRMAIQLEPFVKQPVKGIGEGDLSLSSIGVFLNLRYALIK